MWVQLANMRQERKLDKDGDEIDPLIEVIGEWGKWQILFYIVQCGKKITKLRKYKNLRNIAYHSSVQHWRSSIFVHIHLHTKILRSRS